MSCGSIVCYRFSEEELSTVKQGNGAFEVLGVKVLGRGLDGVRGLAIYSIFHGEFWWGDAELWELRSESERKGEERK